MWPGRQTPPPLSTTSINSATMTTHHCPSIDNAHHYHHHQRHEQSPPPTTAPVVMMPTTTIITVTRTTDPITCIYDMTTTRRQQQWLSSPLPQLPQHWWHPLTALMMTMMWPNNEPPLPVQCIHTNPVRMFISFIFFPHNCSATMMMKRIGPLSPSPTRSTPTCPASPQCHLTMANGHHHQDNVSAHDLSASITWQQWQWHLPMSP